MHWMILSVAFLLTATAAFAGNGGYLFVTFRGEQTPLTEQIYFAVSDDGHAWQAVHDGKPVLISELGEQGARDPYVLRSHDGKTFYLIATDCSINRNHDWGRAVKAGSQSILIWQSNDLVNWSAPRLVHVAPNDAGCTWAPEAVYDQKTGDYLVFFACTTKSDHFAKHRIWATRTKDFITFSDPLIYIERPAAVIDTTIVNEGGTYYRFSKDETVKAITMETSPELMGPWTPVNDFSLAKLQGVEGPECYILNPAVNGKPATWCLVLDQYATSGGYKPFVTTDLASGKFEETTGFTFPFHFRHGSILKVTGDEMDRLKTAYGN